MRQGNREAPWPNIFGAIASNRTLLQDFRYGIRALRANPAFATTTTLTLAVTLALTIGAFTVFNAYVLRPYAFRDT